MAGDGRGTSSGASGGMGQRSSRDWVMLVIFLAAAILLVGRLVWVQVVKGSEYAADAKSQRTRTIELPATRGTIYDRNGNVLATTVDATTIYANPQEVVDAPSTAASIASVLGGTSSDYLSALTKTGTTFAYVKKKADPGVASQLEELDSSGIYFLDDSKRVYPYNGVGNQVIGATDTDDNGVSGLEYEYNDALTGESGELVVQRGQDNTPMSDGTISEVDAVNGSDVIISIDIQLQQHVEQVLRQALTDLNATKGSITVYDGATGEIYATASAPMLSTDNWRDSVADAYTLTTISGAYEPGSTFKSVTASALLNEGVITPDTVIDIPSTLPIDDFVVVDDDQHGDLSYTFREVLEHSSNIGTVLASQKLDRTTYYNYLKAYGFGTQTVDFPGEAGGSLIGFDQWTSATAANVPFGQGLSVTPIQLIRAYGAFTDDGTLNTPHFLLSIAHSEDAPIWATTQVITPQTAATVTDLLESVVSDGGGWHAAMEHYTVAGKTGTAQIASSSGGYQANIYTKSFCGYLPNSGSNLVCLVEIETTEDPRLGPYFADVMGYAADLYQFKADK